MNVKWNENIRGFFLRLSDCGSFLFRNLVVLCECFASMDPIGHEFLAFNILHHIWSRRVIYNYSNLVLLTPIMWCFLGSGGTLNILHQYSVSMVFGTVNCGQNKTHDQADISDFRRRTWRKYSISDLQEDAVCNWISDHSYGKLPLY